MPTLADLFSLIESQKRKASDFISNPSDSLMQMLGNANDRARAFNELNAQAAQESDLTGPANQRLQQALADAYNPAGIFIGPSSKMWNSAAKDMAAKMEKRGFDPKQIWEKTQTFRAGDGKWRQEIDDSTMTLKTMSRWPQEVLEGFNDEGNAQAGFKYFANHKNFSDAYPNFFNSPNYSERLKVRAMNVDDGSGSYNSKSSLLTSGLNGRKLDKATLIHEMQHAVQDQEGFARGATPDMMPELLRQEADRIRKQAVPLFDQAHANLTGGVRQVLKPGLKQQYYDMIKQSQNYNSMANRLENFGGGQNAYQNTLGEIEAEAAARRMNMTPEQRMARFPLLDYQQTDPGLYSVIMQNDKNKSLKNIWDF